jgi:hypothetical protein
LIRSASSTALRSVGSRVASPERSSRFVAGSIRLWTVATGTCFTQTAILIGADSIGEVRYADTPNVSARPVPTAVVVATCLLLLATASVLALGSIALAGDGSYYLVRMIDTERVFGPELRVLGNAVRQVPVLIAVRAGITDTHVLSVVLGLGLLLIPAVAWSSQSWSPAWRPASSPRSR